ncbi:MAG: hypothetical protein QM820_24000 [Minicystis sp.]
MSEPVGSVSVKHAEVESTSGSGRRPRGRLALELVAMRGKDVIGVRHLRDGGTAWVGSVSDAIARVPSRDLGGHPFLVGEVRSGTYVLHLPARARARMHGLDGIPRLMVGPHRMELREGERAVLVLGPVQIRAQLVPFDTAPSGFKVSATIGVWVAAIGLVYAAALAISAALAQPSPPRVEPGAMHRIHGKYLTPAAQAKP